jgi:L-lactate dehydrogenase complex protein LldG
VPVAELDRCDAALTDCSMAMSETGTLLFSHPDGAGRRALTLLPDHHLCVLAASSVVAGVPEGIPTLENTAREGPAAVTLVSGPSATSDIELERVEGVHGPRHLHVFIMTDR